jgi:hemerythrin
MALLTWSDSLSIKVKAMDDQHHVLVDALNELHSALMAGDAQTVTGKLLQNLVEYTKFHFASEEALLKAAEFPGLAQHHLLHLDLVKEVEVFVRRYQQGEEMINLHLMNFLRNWLYHHILEEDRVYGDWINRPGGR